MKTHTQRNEAEERRRNRPLHADPAGETRKEQRVKERHAQWRRAGATSDAESGEDEDVPVEGQRAEDIEGSEDLPIEEDVEGGDEDDEARRQRERLAREEDEEIE